MKTALQTALFILLLVVPSYALGINQPAEVKTISGTGEFTFRDGEVNGAAYRFPTFMAERNGSIYISDTQNHRIRVISPDGNVSTYAGTTTERNQYGFPIGGWKDGDRLNAMFQEPKGLTFDSSGNLIIVDSGNNAIRKIDVNGKVTTITQELNGPTDVVLSNDLLIVTDTMNHRIVTVTLDGVVSLHSGSGYEEEGEWLIGAYQDGPIASAKWNEPSGLAKDEEGNLYVTDTGNQRIRLIQNGKVTTIAGKGDLRIDGTSYIQGGYLDGSIEEATFNFPVGIELSQNGTLYVADTYNHVIRAVSKGKVSTVAGTGESGLQNGTEGEAQFSGPTDILLSKEGLVITDQLNNRVRIVEWFTLPQEPEKADKRVNVFTNGAFVSFDVWPKIVDNRTMVPLRMLSEELGYQVKWDPETRKIELTKDEKTITVTIGNKQITGDKKIELDTTPFIEQNRAFVPLRFIVEAYNYDVSWLSEEKTVLIR